MTTQTTKRKQHALIQHPVTKKLKSHPQKPKVTFLALPRELRQQIILDAYTDSLVDFTVNTRCAFLEFNGEEWTRHEEDGKNRERAFGGAIRMRSVGGVFSEDAEIVYERLIKMAFKAAKTLFGGEIVMHIRRASGFEVWRCGVLGRVPPRAIA